MEEINFYIVSNLKLVFFRTKPVYADCTSYLNISKLKQCASDYQNYSLQYYLCDRKKKTGFRK